MGLASANALASEGVKVSLVGRDADIGRAAAAEICNSASFIQGDLSDSDFRAQLPSRAEVALEGSIDILVTNAGGPATGEFHQQPLDAWRKAYELNLFGPHRHGSTSGTRDGRACVSGVWSILPLLLPKNRIPTCLCQIVFGWLCMVRWHLYRKKLPGEGVTVNNVMPGLMDTGALQRVIDARVAMNNSDAAKVRHAMAAEIPAGRLGTADDFGPVCAFLCSPLACYITGQSIAVDGGLIHGMS